MLNNYLIISNSGKDFLSIYKRDNGSFNFYSTASGNYNSGSFPRIAIGKNTLVWGLMNYWGTESSRFPEGAAYIYEYDK